MRNSFLIILLFSVFFVQELSAQKKVKVRGYVKNLQQFTLFGDSNINVISDNLIHHRLNVKYYPSKSITAAIEFRNRIFTGETIKSNPFFSTTIGLDNGLVDLNWNIIDESAILFNSQIDRAWVEWQKNKWQIRIGRQRINWGMAIAWNPNDLFNVYNLLDFDYEERPGTDALKVSYDINYSSGIEFAFSPDTSFQNSIAALKYNFNKWQYDIQLIAGYYETEIALGFGWAGNIKNGGIKGELMYFAPTGATAIADPHLNFLISYDNVLPGNIFFQSAYLFNNNGLKEFNPLLLLGLNTSDINAKNIFPFQHSILLTGGFTINPLTNSNASFIYSPEANLLILSPVVSLSITETWDINFIAQIFLAGEEKPEHQLSGFYLRTRWSY